MKKIFLVILAVVALSANGFAQTADEVIAKHIEALGGAERLKNLKTMTLEAKITGGGIPAGMELPIKISVINDKSLRTDVEIPGMGVSIVTAIEGETGWTINPMQGKKEPEPLPEEAIKESKDQMDLSGSLFNYKEKGHSVELLGKEDMEGTEVYKLKVLKKDGNTTYEFIDASSYLILKSVSKKKNKDKETENESLSSNYKAVDGLMMPFTIEAREVGGSGGGQVISVDKIVVNPTIDESIFKMPAK